MADKSCYMGAGGYGSGYVAGASNTGYAREEYAAGGSGNTNNNNNNYGGGGASGGSTGGQSAPGVFKPRTDQSCYLGP